MEHLKSGNGCLDQLKQLTKLTWVGDLISKSDTEFLKKANLIDPVGRSEYYIINNEGVILLEKIGLLRV